MPIRDLRSSCELNHPIVKGRCEEELFDAINCDGNREHNNQNFEETRLSQTKDAPADIERDTHQREFAKAFYPGLPDWVHSD